MAAHPAKTLLGVVALAFAAAVCGLVGAYLPPLQIALPVLLGVVVRRVGLLPGAGAWAGALVLLFFMAPPYGPLWVAVATGLPGLLLGLLFKNHVPGGRALAAVVGCSAGVLLLCLPVAVRAGLVSPPPAPMPAAVESLGSLISGAEARAWAGRMWEAARFLAPA
ncbi:MAG: DUF2232 domain-containing protein, partial [Firmicutes bacterium]|nr:DUF2232 domain-containing protein [Bacillota bacterium]